MADLPSFVDLKIESLVAVATYAARSDFGAARRDLLNAVGRSATAALADAGEAVTAEADVDDRGDVAVQFRDASFPLCLGVGPSAAVARFCDVYDHGLARRVLGAFFGQVVEVLGLQQADAMSVEFSNAFDLANAPLQNRAPLGEAVMPGLRPLLAPLLAADAALARIDVSVGWRSDARHSCHVSVQCPANDESATVWTSLHVCTQDGVAVAADRGEIAREVDDAFGLYYGSYAASVRNLLAGRSLDLSQRRLAERSAEDGWSDEQNARRCALIAKAVRGRLSEDETREFADLQGRALEHFDRAAPPPLQGALRLYEAVARARRGDRDDLRDFMQRLRSAAAKRASAGEMK